MLQKVHNANHGAEVPSWFPRGVTLLHDPTLNKGTAFTESERDALGIRGLLPPHVASQDDQVSRIVENFRRKPSDLERYIQLANLHDRNETLFFRVLTEYPDEMIPIVYTPTVGLACQQFAHIFQRPRGIFVSANDRGHIEGMLRNWPTREVAIIVVSDGERILGLGDLGANGMGIPVGKLALYTACAGVHPNLCLPVILDVGTNYDELLRDTLYIGLKQKRLTGKAYDELVDEFITAARRVFPGVVIQFEDFANHNAFRLLNKYRDRICTFNDDIQGTGAVALSGMLSALRVTGGHLGDQRVLFLGAGQAAVGIANTIASAMQAQGSSEDDARRCITMIDVNGLIEPSRTDLSEQQKPYAHQAPPSKDLLATIESFRPTVLIGTSTNGGAFTQPVVEAMSRLNERPIIFALSNPTSRSECTAEQAYRWSDGRALFASGSPFDSVSLDGRAYVPRQCNNSYIFPGIGLAAIVTRMTRITDEMFMAAAHALAEQVTPADLEHGSLYPPLRSVRNVSAHIAAAVAEVAFKHGFARVRRPDNMLTFIRAYMYEPRYAQYVPA